MSTATYAEQNLVKDAGGDCKHWFEDQFNITALLKSLIRIKCDFVQAQHLKASENFGWSF